MDAPPQPEPPTLDEARDASPVADRPGPPAPGPSEPGGAALPLGFALVVAAAVGLVLFWRIGPFFHRAWTDLPYTHGYLLLAVVVWLLYERRSRFRPDAEFWWGAAWIVLGCSLLWLLGEAGAVLTVQEVILLPMSVCAVVAVLGRRSLRELAPLVLAFAWALPFWDVFTPPLQALTVSITTNLLAPLGVAAQVDGNVVTLDHGSFVIADSCAGLAFFVSGSALGYLYGILFLNTWRSRIAAVALSAAIAIVGNWIRVTGIIWIGDASEMRSSLVERHGWFGWAIFTVGLVAFARLARKLEPTDRRSDEGVATAGDGVPEPVGAAVPVAGLAEGLVGRRVLIVSALAAVGPLLYWSLAAIPRTIEVSGTVDHAPGWALVSSDKPGTAWTPAFQGNDEAHYAEWSDGTRVVHVDRLVYLGQAQGQELVHYANRISPPDSLVRERTVLIPGQPRVVREALIRSRDSGILVRYWYDVAGVETHSEVVAKVLEAVGFFRRRGGASLVAVSAPCAADGCAEAAETLTAFLSPQS